MVKIFDLKNSLIGLGYDLEHKATGDLDDVELLSWTIRRLKRIEHEYLEMIKFNGKAYRKELKAR
jgi:hypothetical protein